MHGSDSASHSVVNHGLACRNRSCSVVFFLVELERSTFADGFRTAGLRWMFQTGFIIGRRADLFWFLGLPFTAIAIAMACQQWLPAVAVASVGLWITVPHHFATWLRAYGLKEDWQRHKDRLIFGPLLLAGLTLAGMAWAPITLILVVTLWDHQHSLMQQHGIARIYDFKARTSAPSTGRFDLALNWVLYGNLLLTAPLFTDFWVREVLRWGVPLTRGGVELIRTISWLATVSYVVVYLAHVAWCRQRGFALNPIKYVFIVSSYFLWYFVSWQTASLLVYMIAHRLMHGLQYIAIVHLYLRHKTNRESASGNWLSWLVRPRNLLAFVAVSLFYAAVYQLLTGEPLSQFGFGLAGVMSTYGPVPDLGLAGISSERGYDLFAAMLLQLVPLTHYYFDSFIWKVSDRKVQEGL